MSKNTASNQFRKIDIDQYSEDLFREEENQEVTSPSVGLDDREVNTLISHGKHLEALKYLLARAPVGSKNQMAKDLVLNLVVQVLLSVKASEIDKVVEKLDVDEVDVLMKYIYRGFESPSDGSSAHLLAWHEKTYTKGGVGSIVRVLTDKKKV